MSLNKQPYKGCRDLFPVEKRAQNYIFEKMRLTAESFHYAPYDGPLLEEVDLYRAKSGEELINEQIYSFIDRGGREVAIRPEMTPTLARMVAQVHRQWPKPIRLYSIPNLMRYERPQKGRLREHWQFNCDIFGAEDRLGEVEILQVAIQLLLNLGANHNHFEILANDRNVINSIFSKILKVDDVISHKLYKIIDKAKKVSSEALAEMINALNLSNDQQSLLKEYLNLQDFANVQKFLLNNNLETEASQLAILTDRIRVLDLEKYIKYDPTIVRGLDYYTGLVFEIFDKNPENRRAICGGGAYGNLLQIFNEPSLPAVGFGLGDVTLTDFLKTHKLLPSFETQPLNLVLSYISKDAENSILKLGQELRGMGLNIYTHFGESKLAKIFPHAEKLGANFVGFMGTDELKANSIQLKNLISKEQKSFILSQVNEIHQFVR